MKTLYSFVCLCLLFAGKLFAGDIDVSSLPKLLGSNNMGKEFYFTFIPAWESAGKCDIKLYISSNVKTKVTVEVEGKGYSKTKTTIPNDIIEFTLTPAMGQAYRKGPWEPPEIEQVWRNAAVHVIADDPIICYGVTRYKYTSDGFLALPVNVLGKEYIVASYADISNNNGQWLPSFTGITAAYDKTKVKFTMGGTVSSKTPGGLEPGQTSNWNLDKGDVLLIASLGQLAELTGSKITADKPVSVVSGNFCAYIPTNCGYCDFIMEMELPTYAWGQTYHVTPIVGRKKSSMIKVFAKEAKTKIYKDYQQMGFLRTSGGIEPDGYLHFRVDEGNVRPVVISGDKPINVTQFNTGQRDDDIVSDPFQMVLVPTEQYPKEITFHTPGIRGGFGFPKNYLNLCYEATEYGTIPNDLMFAQVVGGEFEWTALKDFSASPGSALHKIEGGKNYYSKTILLPGDGVYKLKAEKPFQAYSYGFSWCDSYGFPASVSLKRLDLNDTVPPKPEWVMDCDGDVNGTVMDLPDDFINTSNISIIYLYNDLSYNFKLSFDEFIPCEVQTVNWSLEVIDNRQDARAVVTFADCAGNDTTVIIQYEAVKLSVVPDFINYGLKAVGEVVEKFFYIVNESETKASEVNFLKLKRANQSFSLWDSTGTIPIPEEFNPTLLIQPLDSFPFIVRFAASSPGEYWDSIGIGDTCIFHYPSYISAMSGSPIIDVSSWSFPPTMLGSANYGNFTIENIGTVTLEVYDYRGPFLLDKVNGRNIYESESLDEQNITPATPLRLKPMEKREFVVKFTPDEAKFYPDSIVFISNTIKDPALNNGNPIDSVCILAGNGTTVGVDDNSISKNLYIYPVPASDKIMIFSESEINNIRVFDILGCERKCQKAIEEGRSIVNISDLNEGIYIAVLSVVTTDREERTMIKKFIIRK